MPMVLLRAAGWSVRNPTASPCLRTLQCLRSTRRSFTADAATHPTSKTQVYVSRSQDPLVNLSVEHFLLQNTPPDSTILMLYANSPCIVFGRNQNPWLEVNLPQLARISQNPDSVGWTDDAVQLVRRRSGGGTVFHDGGNVNFSVICPSAVFDRDRYAEMVVRALKRLGRPNTRVNVRHDIVMDVDFKGKEADADENSTFKISGSAYKLTRLRSLHHGTCLLRSPNLSNISGLLRSPAEGFIKARGVDSVRSPVRNVDMDNESFVEAVVEEFSKMAGPFNVNSEVTSSDALSIEKVSEGYTELQSRDWVYGQTPRFNFCTHPYEDDPRPRPQLPFGLKMHFEARHGIIDKFDIDDSPCSPRGNSSSLVGKKIWEIADWQPLLKEVDMADEYAGHAGRWMNDVMGVSFTKPASSGAS